MVFVVGKYGQCEPSARLLAWLLLSGGYVGSNNRYVDDREGRTSLVYLLLYDGPQTLFLLLRRNLTSR
jgi:hypothetical protein